MAASPISAIDSVTTEQEAMEVIQALAGKFGLKAHVWGTADIRNLMEEAGIDAHVDTEELSDEQTAEVITEFKETQAWNETGLDIDIAMQDALAEILAKL